MRDPVEHYALGWQDLLIGRLSEFVSFPSVGADPAMADGMETARQWLEALLTDIGFQNIQRLQADEGQPALYAERLDAPGKPTLLVYAHYDVQPDAPLEKWDTPPFEATEVGDRIYGRGISDDKAPMLIALHALAAFIAVEGRLPVNIKLLLEGEEETGSPSLPAILAANRGLLAADAVLSADGARWRSDLPTMNVGTRGMAGFEFAVTTANKDLHSGRYGGILRNPLHVMSALIASLHDTEGRIAVPGFYDGICEPDDATRNGIARIAETLPDTGRIADDVGAAPFGEPGYSLLERLWLRPCLDINGLWGGYTGAGAKTVIPTEASAKLTMRLVPGQDPVKAQDAVIAHLHAQLPDGAALEIRDSKQGSAAYLLPDDHPLLAAGTNALKQVTGETPHKVRIGASLPLTSIVQEKLGIDTVMFSFSISDENFHAPNEFFRKSSIAEGLACWVTVLRKVADQSPATYSAFTKSQ
ncbi:M20/M25/M40 family metallo-hydrolase [uncultured Roseibium sp.]|uniref:M20/M25/M40 family metallo-hydrolase n=1 Tax=uncultured Roseibium sp. TaxID=1936171 RepID=UPI002596BEBF|nr:M20/M25/M40 family metallo-hydrolase [uncultured Roseibium sp.]